MHSSIFDLKLNEHLFSLLSHWVWWDFIAPEKLGNISIWICTRHTIRLCTQFNAVYSAAARDDEQADEVLPADSINCWRIYVWNRNSNGELFLDNRTTSIIFLLTRNWKTFFFSVFQSVICSALPMLNLELTMWVVMAMPMLVLHFVSWNCRKTFDGKYLSKWANFRRRREIYGLSASAASVA